MKHLSALAASLFFVSAASAQSVPVNMPLTDKILYDIVYQSAEDYLEFDGGDVHGGLSGDLKNPVVISETLVAGFRQIQVNYGVYFLSVDSDFGDPVHEEEFQCTSRLTAIIGEPFTVENTVTTCDLNPKVDFKDYSNPCCPESGPIVDSNMCFDSSEEGEAFCSAL